jgi:hypothetical protein
MLHRPVEATRGKRTFKLLKITILYDRFRSKERPFAPADLELFDRLRNVERGPLRPFPPCKKAARSEVAVVGADDDVILP